MTYYRNSFFLIGLLTWLIFLQYPFLAAQEPSSIRYGLEGRLYCPSTGILHLYLCDQKTFSQQNSGIAERQINIPEPGSYTFDFRNIPEGRYAIKTFLDTDGNGRLNRSLTGPAEPWGFSGPMPSRFQKPRFSQASFTLSEIESPLVLTLIY